MLVFVDQDKHVRIVRAEMADGVSSRAPLGRIMKNRLEIAEDLRALLSDEETESVAQMIDVYKNAAAARAEYYSLSFPEIAREVMDRFEQSASDAERQLISGALMEAVRRMRKFERENQPA
jgi:hypothetical protein